MLERGLALDHVTIWRWVQRYAPVLNQRLEGERRRPNRFWRVDETGRRKLGIPVPRGRRHDRFHVVAQSGFGCCQPLLAISVASKRAIATRD